MTALGMLIALVGGIIAARALGVAGRGELAAVILWPAVLCSLVELGLPTASTYLSASRPDSRYDLARTVVPMLAVQSLLVWLAGTPLILAVLNSYPRDVQATAIGFLFVYAPLYLSVRYLSALNQGAGRMGVFNVARLLIPSVYGGTLLALLLLGVVGVRVFAAAYAGSWLVALVALLAMSTGETRKGALHPKFDWETARLSWSIGRQAYFGSLAPVDTLQLDVLLTTALLGAQEAGLYFVATSAAAVVRTWGTTSRGAFAPSRRRRGVERRGAGRDVAVRSSDGRPERPLGGGPVRLRGTTADTGVRRRLRSGGDLGQDPRRRHARRLSPVRIG